MWNRLTATIYLDMLQQLRSGFYIASGLMVVLWAAVFMPISKDVIDFGYLIPAVLVVNLLMVTFYYMGGLFLLEKSSAVLDSLIVSPLRHREYLISKLVTLTLLGLAESLAVVFLIYGMQICWLWMIMGLVLLSAIYVLLGFVSVARYEALNDYLLPSILVVTLLILPLIGYFHIWNSWIFWLHPAQGGLIFMAAGLGQEVSGWQLTAAGASCTVWMMASYRWATITFQRQVVG